jgi:hypothetical protein
LCAFSSPLRSDSVFAGGAGCVGAITFDIASGQSKNTELNISPALATVITSIDHISASIGATKWRDAVCVSRAKTTSTTISASMPSAPRIAVRASNPKPFTNATAARIPATPSA